MCMLPMSSELFVIDKRLCMMYNTVVKVNLFFLKELSS
jgi:hypothetical protein